MNYLLVMALAGGIGNVVDFVVDVAVSSEIANSLVVDTIH